MRAEEADVLMFTNTVGIFLFQGNFFMINRSSICDPLFSTDIILQYSSYCRTLETFCSVVWRDLLLVE
jgi:hypothetical protein